MIEHDFPEDFVPIAAELQRLPYLSPSRGFADRVISRIDRLQAPSNVESLVPSRGLELHQGGRRAVTPRRKMSVVRATGKAVVGVGLIAAAAFMFFEIDILTAILSAATTQYGFAIVGAGSSVGAAVLGPATVAYLQSGALEAVMLYITLAVGFFGGYGAIRTAAHIAQRKAA
ncbi:MAG: hypothetical protein ACRENK_12430 [Gemmatimonadaceae bacterium]